MENLLSAKKVFCIFAHPDDESFGPGGTIAKLSKNSEVQIICVTDGNSPGTKIKDLDKVRKLELEASCNVLGVKRIHYLNYEDGSLCNGLYHELAGKIQEILDKEKPDTLITFEPRGLSGHIDHIAVSMITTYLFEKLNYTKNLYYYCISERARKLIPNYFIHFPQGYKKEEIDITVPLKDVWKTRIDSMKCHKSQSKDMRGLFAMFLLLPKEEYFLKYEGPKKIFSF